MNVLKEFKKNKNIYSDKLIILLLILNFLIILFPLKSTGSIFTTWNGTLIWLSVALMNYKSNVQKKLKYIVIFFFFVLSLFLTVFFVGIENFWFNQTSWLYGSGDLTNAQLSWQFFLK